MVSGAIPALQHSADRGRAATAYGSKSLATPRGHMAGDRNHNGPEMPPSDTCGEQKARRTGTSLRGPLTAASVSERPYGIAALRPTSTNAPSPDCSDGAAMNMPIGWSII